MELDSTALRRFGQHPDHHFLIPLFIDARLGQDIERLVGVITVNLYVGKDTGAISKNAVVMNAYLLNRFNELIQAMGSVQEVIGTLRPK